jgi:hypothetical protein
MSKRDATLGYSATFFTLALVAAMGFTLLLVAMPETARFANASSEETPP